jgi:large conductance mechanosensitive channel
MRALKGYQKIPQPPQNSIDGGYSIPTQPELHQLIDISMQQVQSFWSDFSAFIQRGSAVDFGVGIIVGSVLDELIHSAMADLLSPPIGLLLSSTLRDAFTVLRQGNTPTAKYITLDEAKRDGAVTINYGLFLETLLNFILTSLIIYACIRSFAAFGRRWSANKSAGSLERLCPACDEKISARAHRCPKCTTSIMPLISPPAAGVTAVNHHARHNH